MRKQSLLKRGPIAVVFVVCFTITASAIYPFSFSHGQGQPMTNHASGTFQVKINPLEPYNNSSNGLIGRMSIDKLFSGDLEGTSKGEMLTAGTAVKDSAGYVAIERVKGTLKGRTGSFVLQHSGTMNRGAAELLVTVVPDSGTEQLAGLTGRMTINITGGKHSYEFEYSLPSAK